MARRLEVEIIGDARSLNRALNSSQSTTKGFAKNLGNLGKTAVGVAGAAGIGALIYSLKTGIGEYQDSQKVAAQTNAVIKSTGKVANVSAKEVDDLATSIMKKSGFDDEAVKSGENLLLTFTNIRNEAGKGNKIFDQATKLTADLSVAFHKDLNQSAVLVGKALNDPIKGLTALGRVGVQFTEGQKKTIKSLVDSGHLLQAQKMIIGEVNKQVGGSAEAFGKTLPGQIAIARESFNNFAGDLVAKSIPYIERFINVIRENWPQISAIIKKAWSQDIKPTLTALSGLVVQIVATIKQHWNTIGPLVMGMVTIIRNAIAQVRAILKLLTAILRGDWSAAWTQAKQIVINAWNQMKAIVAQQVRIIITILRGLLSGIVALGKLALSAGEKLGMGIVNGIVNALKGLAGKVWALVRAAVNPIIDRINSLLSFHVKVGVPGFHKTIGVDPPDIPHLASGGIVKSPTVALLGERGPEAVIPLGGGRGGRTMTVQLVLPDGRMVAEWLFDPLKSVNAVRAQRTGRPAFG